MKLGFIFHLYQPALQEESIFRKVYDECYYPLVKFIKSHRDFSLTLNIPLSLLEQMDKYGYNEWIDDIRNLYDSNRIELTGTAAYHPLLPFLNKQLIEDQVILNEMGLGYYFGSHKDFEGSPALMLKDIRGFFPPELAVNEFVIKTISDLGYEWIVSNNVSLCKDGECPMRSSVFQYKDYATKILIRDQALSNMLAFKRDLDPSDIMSYLSSYSDNDSFVVVLDGETFGHHFRSGLALLEILYAKLRSVGISIDNVTNIIHNYEYNIVKDIHESTWGAAKCDECGTKGYPLWLEEGNKVQEKIKEQQDSIIELITQKNILFDEGSMPWKNETNQEVLSYVNMLRYLSSDKFWWVSKQTLPAGEYLYSKQFVNKYMDIIDSLLPVVKTESSKTSIINNINQIKDML